ncbi:unnamed protein product, partial [Allacma fusca]
YVYNVSSVSGLSTDASSAVNLFLTSQIRNSHFRRQE